MGSERFSELENKLPDVADAIDMAYPKASELVEFLENRLLELADD